MTKQSAGVAHPQLVDGSTTSLHSHAGGGGGGLVDKGGMVTTDGSGLADVSFNTNYISTDYFILLTSGVNSDAITCLVVSGSKAVNGFSVNTKEDKGLDEPSVDVYWATGAYSNP